MALFGKKNSSSDSDSATVPPADSAAVAVADDAPATGDANGKGKKARAPKAPKAAAKPRSLKNGTAVGLNIGNSFIKAVEVTAKNGELSITGMGVVPTPPESYANGNVLSISALSSAIKTLWKQAGFKSKNAVFSVSGTGSLVVRVIEVPKMTDGELADNMRVDADRYIPFPPSEVIMDFKALRDLPSDPDAPNMEVLLAAAQREVIDLHVRVVQKSGQSPSAIDVEPIAAARAVALEKRGAAGYVDYDDVSALLNIGATGTEISVLRGDLVVFTRTVPIGGNNLTTAIAENLGLPLHDAEKFKIERGDALPPPGYDPNAANDFGFDQFGGGQADLSYGAFDTTQTAGGGAAASDPFDLDFFNQPPQGNEPGAGHSQKEGEDSEPGPFSFSFDPDPANAPSKAEPSVPAPTPAPAPAPVDFSFDFPADPATSTPAAETAPAPVPPVSQTPPATSMPTVPSAFDFSDFDLPATAEAATPTAAVTPTPITPTSVPPVAAVPVPATPTPAPAPEPAAPDAFGFGLLSEPAGAPGGESLPSIAASAADAAASTPSLAKEPDATATAPTLDLSKAEDDAPDFLTPPPGDVLVAEASTAGAEDFDLDALFGSTPGQTAASSPASAASGDAFDLGGLDVGAVAGGAAGAGVASAGMAAGAPPRNDGGFDLGAVGGTDDIGDFGVGLGAANMSDADAIALYNAIHPVLEELAGEIRRSLEFHLGRYPDSTFSRLQLIGGGARLKNLDSYLTQMITVPTVVASPAAHLAMRAPKLSPEYVNANGAICAVALGLALRDFIE